MRIGTMGSLLAVSALVSGILVAGTGTGAMAAVRPQGRACPAGWEISIITNYGHVFKPKWTGPGIDNHTSVPQGPETFTSTYTGSVTSTVSTSLGGSLDFEIAQISSELGITQSQTTTFTRTTSDSFTAPAHEFLHIQYGETQYHTYVEREYVQSNCNQLHQSFGDVYSDWTHNWKVWTTAA